MTNPTVEIGVAPEAPPEPDSYYWPALIDGLTRFLRIKAAPIGMKLFETVAEIEAVEHIHRPDRKSRGPTPNARRLALPIPASSAGAGTPPPRSRMHASPPDGGCRGHATHRRWCLCTR